MVVILQKQQATGGRAGAGPRRARNGRVRRHEGSVGGGEREVGWTEYY